MYQIDKFLISIDLMSMACWGKGEIDLSEDTALDQLTQIPNLKARPLFLGVFSLLM